MKRRAITLTAALAVASAASAIPLGLRLTQQAAIAANSGPTARDYVQDGLIAMWDGEWNAGRGVHDSAATVWKDLVGSRDVTMVDMTTSTNCWEKNCAYADDGHLTRYGLAPIADARAIECVYMPTKYGAAYAGVLVFNNGISATTEAQGYVVNILTRRHYGSSGMDGLQVAYDKFAYFDTKSVFNTIYTYTAQYSTVYRNAVGFEVQTMSGDSWGGGALVLGERNGSLYNAPGRFYCVRIYDRELTAAEVAHNYEVDRRRFGSGNE